MDMEIKQLIQDPGCPYRVVGSGLCDFESSRHELPCACQYKGGEDKCGVWLDLQEEIKQMDKTFYDSEIENSQELKSSREWATENKIGGIRLFGEKEYINDPIFTVEDPDGWDRINLKASLEELITKNEFLWRITQSSISDLHNYCEWTIKFQSKYEVKNVK